MTATFLALAAAAVAAAQAAPADGSEARLRACTAEIRAAPDKAIATADRWRLAGGGLPARMCLGLAYAAAERWPAAATAFEQAAREAEAARDGRAADLWTQSGNASLAAGDAAAAAKAFDAALASPSLQAELRGEVHLDRARARVALGDAAGARADIDKGLELVAADPFGWYLSAALARREKNLDRAQKDISRAVELAPGEAPILLEAGNIAGMTGDLPTARALYARAARADPEGAVGRAAAGALAANGSDEAEAAPAPAPAQAAAAPAPKAQSR